MGYPPVAFAAQDDIIAALTAAGATEPGAGITRQQLGLRRWKHSHTDALGHLLELGVVVEGPGERLHLVEPQARRLIAGRTGFHPWKLA